MGWLAGELVRSLFGHHLLSPIVIFPIFSPVAPEWRGDGILEVSSSSYRFPICTLVQEVFDFAGLKHRLVFPPISFPTSCFYPFSQAMWCHLNQEVKVQEQSSGNDGYNCLITLVELGSSAASLAGLSRVLSQEAGGWGTSLTWPHGHLLPGVAVPKGFMP